MGQKNWVLMNQTNIKVDSNDKKMKLDRFMVKKIVLGTVRGDQFLYLSFRFDYKVSSKSLQCYSLHFPIPLSLSPFFFYTLSTFHLHVPCACQMVGVDIFPINLSPKSSCSSCKAENYCLGIISTLMRLEGQLQSI